MNENCIRANLSIIYNNSSPTSEVIADTAVDNTIVYLWRSTPVKSPLCMVFLLVLTK